MRRHYVPGGRQARARRNEPIGAQLRLSFRNDALSEGAHAGFRAARQRHAGAAADYRALRRVLELRRVLALCRGAADAIDDRYCRDKLRLVEDLSAEMLAHGQQRTEFLKQQILNALELFRSRLYSLEMLRRSTASRLAVLT
jgi:hypothetical protein